MEVKVEFTWNDDYLLLCPQCSEGWMHQRDIEVFTDFHTVVHSGFNGGEVQIDDNMSNNPSSRREGLIIHFECENEDCSNKKLKIYQHKGQTLLKWGENNE